MARKTKTSRIGQVIDQVQEEPVQYLLADEIAQAQQIQDAFEGLPETDLVDILVQETIDVANPEIDELIGEADISEMTEDMVSDSDDDALYGGTVDTDEATVVKKVRKAKVEGEEKAPKAKREPSPYAGLSPHQKNRAIALAKYGTRPGYAANDFRIHIEPTLRAQIQAVLDGGKIRPSAKGKSHGGDRYLMGVAKAGWPEGAITIEYPDEYQAKRESAAAKRAEAAKAKVSASEAKKLAMEEARALEAAEAALEAQNAVATADSGQSEV
jgi:hypothetical protein